MCPKWSPNGVQFRRFKMPFPTFFGAWAENESPGGARDAKSTQRGSCVCYFSSKNHRFLLEKTRAFPPVIEEAFGWYAQAEYNKINKSCDFQNSMLRSIQGTVAGLPQASGY